MSDEGAIIRLQGYAREQRSTVNSLFLTYAAAVLGLQSSILLAKDIIRVDHPWLFLAAGFGALLSFAAGCTVVLVRLRSARLTARITRYEAEARISEIGSLRRSTERLGTWTNGLLNAQVAMFAISAIAFLLWVSVTAWGKLGFSAG